MTRELLKQALEALQLCANGEDDVLLTRDALADLREALEQPSQKPVAWMYSDAEGNNPVPVYAAPLVREWVGLTDEEMAEVANTAETYTESVKLTEAKLKEKNT